MKSQLAATATALRDARWKDVRRWYVNGQGQTMVVIPNPAEHGNSQINHSFTIASHEVTVAEFLRFLKQHDIDSGVAPTDDCPANQVSWYDAAAYCNWLSRQEGIPADQWVYEPNPQGKYGNNMTIRANALELTGYRLPTRTEWEYACRAGSSGTYSFGEPVLLLDQYAWYGVSSSGRTHSVASLLPNENGLFDMHGNVWEWTQSPADGVLMSPVHLGGSRLLRSGSYADLTSPMRSAYPDFTLGPAGRYKLIAFRPSRTYHFSP